MQGTQSIPGGLSHILGTWKKAELAIALETFQFIFFIDQLQFWSIENPHLGEKCQAEFSQDISVFLVRWKTMFCHPFMRMKNILKYQNFLVNGCHRFQLYLFRVRFFLHLLSQGSSSHVTALLTISSVWGTFMNGNGNLSQRDYSASFTALLVYVPVVILACNCLTR